MADFDASSAQTRRRGRRAQEHVEREGKRGRGRGRYRGRDSSSSNNGRSSPSLHRSCRSSRACLRSSRGRRHLAARALDVEQFAVVQFGRGPLPLLRLSRISLEASFTTAVPNAHSTQTPTSSRPTTILAPASLPTSAPRHPTDTHRDPRTRSARPPTSLAQHGSRKLRRGRAECRRDPDT